MPIKKEKMVLSFQNFATRMAQEDATEGCRPCDPNTGKPQSDDEAFAMNLAIFRANGNEHLPADANPNKEVQKILQGARSENDLDAEIGGNPAMKKAVGQQM